MLAYGLPLILCLPFPFPWSCLFEPKNERLNIRALSYGDDEERKGEAAKLIANLVVIGSGILGRAVLQAYRKALENANKNGVANEAINNIRRASKTMTEQEAKQILGISEHSTWEEVLQKYNTLFENNAKSGSFYLQSKVHRAKECLEAVYQKNNQGTS